MIDACRLSEGGTPPTVSRRARHAFATLRHDIRASGVIAMTRMFVVLCALMLAGCGAAKIDSRANARAEYQKSIDDEYRACINDNLKNVEKCQAKRALIEANERPPNNVATESAQRGNTAETAQRTTAATATGSTQAASAANTTQITSSLPARILPTPPEIADPEPRDTRSTPTPTPF